MRHEDGYQPEPSPAESPGSLSDFSSFGAFAAKFQNLSLPSLAPTRSCDGAAGRALLRAGVCRPQRSDPLFRERPEQAGEHRCAGREGSGQPSAGGETGDCSAPPAPAGLLQPQAAAGETLSLPRSRRRAAPHRAAGILRRPGRHQVAKGDRAQPWPASACVGETSVVDSNVARGSPSGSG